MSDKQGYSDDGALPFIPTNKIYQKYEIDRFSDDTIDESPISNLEPKPVLNFIQADIALNNNKIS